MSGALPDLFSLLDDDAGGSQEARAVSGAADVDAMRARPCDATQAPAAAVLGASGGPCILEPGSDSAGAAQAAEPKNQTTAATTTPSYPFEDDCAEVGSMRVTQLASLPLATTVRVALPAGGTGLSPLPPVAFLVTYSRAAYTAARESKVLVLKGGELAALALAAASGRATEAELRKWLGRKRAEAAWDLTPQFAVAGIASTSIVRGSDGFGDGCLGDVLHAYGARVVAVGVGDTEGLALVAEIANAAAEVAKKKGRAA